MNCYALLDIPMNADLLKICKSYRKKCLTNPEKIFIYTEAFSILIDPIKRIIYDANTFKISLPILMNAFSTYQEYQNIDEFELINFIEWLNFFKDFFYDTKYYTNNNKYHNIIESWYDIIENIIEELKSHIESIYLI